MADLTDETGRHDGASTEVDRIARLLIAEWERVERKPVNVSYVATFADMARVVAADREKAAGREHVERVVRELVHQALRSPSRRGPDCQAGVVSRRVADRLSAPVLSTEDVEVLEQMRERAALYADANQGYEMCSKFSRQVVLLESLIAGAKL